MGHRARAKFVVMTDCVPSNEQTFYPQSSLGKSTRQSTLLSTGMRPCHGISASGWDCLKPRSDGSRFEECSRHTRRGRGERQRRGRKIFDDNAGKGKERGKGKGKRKRKRGGARGSRPPSGLGWLLFYPRGGCVDRAPGGGGRTGGVEGWAVLARVERKKEKKRKSWEIHRIFSSPDVESVCGTKMRCLPLASKRKSNSQARALRHPLARLTMMSGAADGGGGCTARPSPSSTGLPRSIRRAAHDDPLWLRGQMALCLADQLEGGRALFFPSAAM